MRVLLAVFATVALASALVVREDGEVDVGVVDEHDTVVVGRDNIVTWDIKKKEVIVMKLMNHILQPTIYDDIREVARDFKLEDNIDKFLNVEVVKKFIAMYHVGMLPVSEIFVHSNVNHMDQVVKVFRLMYFAKDFDTMIRTACWLRERINRGMFVYAFYATIFHREDCRGIVVPAPYEIYPFYFVDSRGIQKIIMTKMAKNSMDSELGHYGIEKVVDKNMVILKMRKGVRHTLTEEDRIAYFTEDIDLNSYMYFLHLMYPYWITDDVFVINKERRGEIMIYSYQQLLARIRLERLGHKMCHVTPLTWHVPLATGYWPRIMMHNGESMPMRRNNVMVINEDNIKYKLLIDDLEKIVRDGILTGRVELRDGTILTLKKPEDIEKLSRLILGGIGILHDDAKVIHLTTLFKTVLSYSVYNHDKYTYVPTALDNYATCLRDPVFWKIMKRITDIAVLFKGTLPVYTREELDFPGVKVDKVVTDELVTFMDDYDMDVTNAVYLDEVEVKKKRSNMLYVVRQRRLNNHPFKVTIEVESDKAVDAVVRVFIGPKHDCMGRLLDVNDKRLDMVEIDTFLHRLDTGRNVIVRKSVDMHGVIDDRPWTRFIWDQAMKTVVTMPGKRIVDNWWSVLRVGFPRRLLLPLGTVGGLPLQMYVIVSPVRTGLLTPGVDINIMKERKVCRWSTCIDTMPLGYPFDRHIDMTNFFTTNMKFIDIVVVRKDMDLINVSRGVDMSNLVMKRDDLTYLDNDMLVPRTYRDMMMMGVDRMTRM